MESTTQRGSPATAFVYTDSTSNIVAKRIGPTCRWPALKPRVLYNLPVVENAKQNDELIYLVDSERKANEIKASGLTATTVWPNDGVQWQPEYTHQLQSASVVVVYGHDSNELAFQAVLKLYGETTQIRVLSETRINGNWSELPSLVDSVAPFDGDFDSLTTQLYHDDEFDSTSGTAWKPMPVHCFPKAVADYIHAQARAIGCDASLVGVPILAALSAAVGNSYRIELKKSWYEPSVLWTMIIGRSGTHKSPGINAAQQPVVKLERQARELFEMEHARFESGIRHSKCDNPNSEQPKEPKQRRYRISDATVEAVLSVHQENRRGLLLVRDELSGWFGGFDQYKRGNSDAPTWIEMYGGFPVSVDRKTGTKKVLNIDRPHVAVTGGSQPGTLQEVITRRMLLSGLFARFALAWPPEVVVQWSDADVTSSVLQAYEETVSGLYRIPMSDATLPISPNGKREYESFFNECNFLAKELPEGLQRTFAAKLPGLTARLALILHLSDTVAFAKNCAPCPVSLSAVKRAILLARWIQYETNRVYQKLGLCDKILPPNAKYLPKLPTRFRTASYAKTKGCSERQARRDLEELTEQNFVMGLKKGWWRNSL